MGVRVTLNTKSSYALRLLIPLHWIVIAAVATIKPFGGAKLAMVAGILVFYVPAALICMSVLIDWFTQRDTSRRNAKLIDSSIWVFWIISMGYIVLYSLQMGTL